MSARHHALLRALDDTMAKALGVREVARVARIESLQRQFLLVEWRHLAVRASRAATSVVRRGKSRLTLDDADRAASAVDATMRRWSKRVAPRVRDDAGEMYLLGRQAGLRKGTGADRSSLAYNSKPFPARVRATEKAAPRIDFDLDLVDKEAVKAIRRQQTFWVGQHYSKNVARTVRGVARRTIIEQGFGQRAAGRAMGPAIRSALRGFKTPGGWSGSDALYFEMLAANAATVARVQGQLRSFETLGFATYEIVNPSDRRTCQRCAMLDGKVFTVQDGRRIMDAEMGAKTPDAVRAAHPWPSLGALQGLSSGAGHVSAADSRALASQGIALPPFHGKCRCTVDVDLTAAAPVVVPPSPPKPKPKPAPLRPPKPPAPRISDLAELDDADWDQLLATRPAGMSEREFYQTATRVEARTTDQERRAVLKWSQGYDTTIRELDRLPSSGAAREEAMQKLKKGVRKHANWRVYGGSPEKHLEQAQEARLRLIEFLKKERGQTPPMRVYRGLHDLTEEKVTSKFLATDTHELESTSSASRRARIARGFAKTRQADRYGVVLAIEQRSGVAIETMSYYDAESEIVLSKARKFRITKRRRSKNVVYVFMEEI